MIRKFLLALAMACTAVACVPPPPPVDPAPDNLPYILSISATDTVAVIRPWPIVELCPMVVLIEPSFDNGLGGFVGGGGGTSGTTGTYTEGTRYLGIGLNYNGVETPEGLIYPACVIGWTEFNFGGLDDPAVTLVGPPFEYVE